MFASKSTRAARLARAFLGAAVAASLASSAGAADPGAADAREDSVPSSPPAPQSMKRVDVTRMIDTQKKGYVTREELLEFQRSVLDEIARDRDRRVPEPEFTDRG